VAAPTFDSIPEFKEILIRLRAAAKPVGPIEEFLVRQLASALFRSTHLERIHLGLLDHQLANITEDFSDSLPDDLPEPARQSLLLGAAFERDSSRSNALSKLARIDNHFDRSFHRNLVRLHLLQRARAPRAEK